MTNYDEFLERWFRDSRAYQVEKKGKAFDLTLPEFHALFSPNQRATIRKHLKAGSIDGFMGSNFGYVLSWVSKEAGVAGVMNATTAKILPREPSRKLFRIQKGETQSVRARAKIGAAKRGKKQSPEHVAARAEAQRGMKRKPVSDETRAKVRAAAIAREAAKREARAV